MSPIFLLGQRTRHVLIFGPIFQPFIGTSSKHLKRKFIRISSVNHWTCKIILFVHISLWLSSQLHLMYIVFFVVLFDRNWLSEHLSILSIWCWLGIRMLLSRPLERRFFPRCKFRSNCRSHWKIMLILGSSDFIEPEFAAHLNDRFSYTVRVLR